MLLFGAAPAFDILQFPDVPLISFVVVVFAFPVLPDRVQSSPSKSVLACVTRDWLLCPYAPVHPFTHRTLLNKQGIHKDIEECFKKNLS